MRQNQTLKTEATVDYVLSQIRDGRSLREACGEVDISRRTFWDWVDKDPELHARYRAARDAQLDAWADDLRTPIETMDPLEIANAQRIDRNTMWLLARLRPERYGEKTKHEHTGANGGPILQQTTIMDEQVAGGMDALRAVTGGTEPRRRTPARH